MGIELVKGRDLLCHDNVVSMRTTSGEQRVDVVDPRVDDDFLDPLQFRGNSLIGCAGIVNAARAGNITIANAIGNGVADDKLIYTYVPAIIEYYLGKKSLLSNVTTYRLEDDEQRAEALSRLEELVIKPVDASGGYGIVIGPQASDEELAEARTMIESNPRQYIAEEFVRLSTVPTSINGNLHHGASIYARSPSTTARTSGSCRAVSLEWPCVKTVRSSTRAKAADRKTPGYSPTLVECLGAPKTPRPHSACISRRAALYDFRTGSWAKLRLDPAAATTTAIGLRAQSDRGITVLDGRYLERADDTS